MRITSDPTFSAFINSIIILADEYVFPVPGGLELINKNCLNF